MIWEGMKEKVRQSKIRGEALSENNEATRGLVEAGRDNGQSTSLSDKSIQDASISLSISVSWYQHGGIGGRVRPDGLSSQSHYGLYESSHPWDNLWTQAPVWSFGASSDRQCEWNHVDIFHIGKTLALSNLHRWPCLQGCYFFPRVESWHPNNNLLDLGSCLTRLIRLGRGGPHRRAQSILGKPCWPSFRSLSMEMDNWTLLNNNNRYS